MEVYLDLKSLDWRLDDGSAKLICDALALRLFSNSSRREIIVFNPEGINLPKGLVSSSRLSVSDILRLDVVDKNCARLNYNNTTIRYYPKPLPSAESQDYKTSPEIVVVVEKGVFLKGNADILARYNIRLA